MTVAGTSDDSIAALKAHYSESFTRRRLKHVSQILEAQVLKI